MNFEKQQDINMQLRNAYPVKSGKRFISFFIDFLILSLVAYLLSLGFLPLLKNSSTYQAAENKVQEEIRYYNNYISDTHLVSFIDDEKKTRKDKDIMVFENLSKAIYLSYKTFDEGKETPQFSDYVIKNDSSLAKYGVASFENDDLSYFYTIYVPSVQKNGTTLVNFQGDSPALYVYYLYKNSSMSSLFTFGETTSLPVFPSHIAYSLFVYLTQEKNDVNQNVYNAGESYYSTFYNGYSSLLSSAESLCIKAEPYYSSHYLVYREAISSEGRIMNLALLISIVISYLLSLVLPKLIFRHDQTFGRKILSLYVTDKEGESPVWYYTLLSSFLGIFGYLPVMFLFYMLPPFNGVFDSMFTPFIGNIALIWILAIPIFIAMVNYIPSLFFADRETLLEMVFKTRLKDKKDLGEITDAEIEQGRDY